MFLVNDVVYYLQHICSEWDIYRLGRTLDCQAQLKQIHLKVLIGVSIRMLARFIVNVGFQATM